MSETGYILHEPTPEEIAAAMAAFERMEAFARKPQSELNELFDSTAFNDIVRGYLIIALESAGNNRKQIRQALAGLDSAFDIITAEQARKKYAEF